MVRYFTLAEIFGSNLQCFGCVFNSQNQPYCTLWELAKPDGSTCCLESKSQLCRVFSKLLDSQYPKNLFNLSPTLGRGLHPLVLHLSYHSIFFWHLPFSISSYSLFLNSIFSGTIIDALDFFISVGWNTFFFIFIFSVCVFLDLKWVYWRQQIFGSNFYFFKSIQPLYAILFEHLFYLNLKQVLITLLSC